ncbi:hypothetical protein [Clostridium merdae]|nr:hypothetical protein [Clostridium merdae]
MNGLLTILQDKKKYILLDSAQHGFESYLRLAKAIRSTGSE